MHDDDSIDNVSRKPVIIMDYNSTKGGVDTVDQLLIFHCNNPDDKTLRRHFLEKLSFSLQESHLKVRAYMDVIPRSIRQKVF
ncbi:hypothetical protein PPYR_01218 [Photinus pyralis]|uniref:Uncharacterized protein n=1 Tax=Photinus pyralis TaxID=7054 RepID=A0A5N4B3Z3_PHOPY|nr:hypothetical protein PPYR_01218 [Photinus pyralis]